jgi:hypothetical protein
VWLAHTGAPCLAAGRLLKRNPVLRLGQKNGVEAQVPPRRAECQPWLFAKQSSCSTVHVTRKRNGTEGFYIFHH